MNEEKLLADDNSSSSGYASNETQDDDENIPTLDDIRDLRRGCQVPREGLMCDLLWADPQVSMLNDINLMLSTNDKSKKFLAKLKNLPLISFLG